MITYNKIVNKLGNKGGKIIFKSDIYDIIDPERRAEYANFLDKTIYKLKAQGYIISLKAGVYIVPNSEDKQMHETDLLDTYYPALLKKYISYYTGNSYYISGKKALEFHMKNFSIPEKIYIVNTQTNKRIRVGNYEIIFTVLHGKCNQKKQLLYPIFSKFLKQITLGGLRFKIAGDELALVETAILQEAEEGIDISLLTKAIKKYGNVYDLEVFSCIGKWKYNMAFNRLKEITRVIHPQLHTHFLQIIKQNGGCFVGEGLRNI